MDTGRPTILTDEIQTKIIQALTGGNYLETACQYAGIQPRTAYLWLDKGRKAQTQQNPTTNQQKYLNFLQAVEKAQATSETRNVALIQQAATETWQAAAWWLERTRPARYGKSYKHEIGGSDTPIQVSVEAQREQALDSLDKLSERMVTAVVEDDEEEEVDSV